MPSLRPLLLSMPARFGGRHLLGLLFLLAPLTSCGRESPAEAGWPDLAAAVDAGNRALGLGRPAEALHAYVWALDRAEQPALRRQLSEAMFRAAVAHRDTTAGFRALEALGREAPEQLDAALLRKLTVWCLVDAADARAAQGLIAFAEQWLDAEQLAVYEPERARASLEAALVAGHGDVLAKLGYVALDESKAPPPPPTSKAQEAQAEPRAREASPAADPHLE